MGKPDIGETSASINFRADRQKWPEIREALHAGAYLWRPPGLKNYYTFCKDPNDALHNRSLGEATVNRLAEQGVLTPVGGGGDRYGLTPDETDPAAVVSQPTPGDGRSCDDGRPGE